MTNHAITVAELAGINPFPTADVIASEGSNAEAFWESIPVEVWREKAAETVNALNGETDIVLMSGRYGTGKTQQYGRLLVHNFQDDSWYFDDAIESLDFSYSESSVFLDEVQALTHFSPERIPDFLGQLAGRKAVLVFTGPSVAFRRDNVETLQKQVAEILPDVGVVNIGDVSRAPINGDKAASVVRALGGSLDAADLVEGTTALREPRVFDRFIICRSMFLRGEYNAADIKGVIADLVAGKATLANRGIVNNIVSGTTWEGNPYRPGKHVIFESGSMTTAESIELYDLVGAPIPGPEAFTPEIVGRELGYDPLAKD
jgi:hypothetical protein